MKLYRLKLKMGNEELYAKGIIFGSENDKLKFQVMPAFDKEDAGIFEEDKARIYCEELNKQNGEPYFELEEV
mgnify:FL=1